LSRTWRDCPFCSCNCNNSWIAQIQKLGHQALLKYEWITYQIFFQKTWIFYQIAERKFRTITNVCLWELRTQYECSSAELQFSYCMAHYQNHYTYDHLQPIFSTWPKGTPSLDQAQYNDQLFESFSGISLHITTLYHYYCCLYRHHVGRVAQSV